MRSSDSRRLLFSLPVEHRLGLLDIIVYVFHFPRSLILEDFLLWPFSEINPQTSVFKSLLCRYPLWPLLESDWQFPERDMFFGQVFLTFFTDRIVYTPKVVFQSFVSFCLLSYRISFLVLSRGPLLGNFSLDILNGLFFKLHW